MKGRERGNVLAATMFWCLMGTPFGVPVEPEVYMIAARSSGPGVLSLDVGFVFPCMTRSSNSMKFTLGKSFFRSRIISLKILMSFLKITRRRDGTAFNVTARREIELESTKMATESVDSTAC